MALPALPIPKMCSSNDLLPLRDFPHLLSALRHACLQSAHSLRPLSLDNSSHPIDSIASNQWLTAATILKKYIPPGNVLPTASTLFQRITFLQQKVFAPNAECAVSLARKVIEHWLRNTSPGSCACLNVLRLTGKQTTEQLQLTLREIVCVAAIEVSGLQEQGSKDSVKRMNGFSMGFRTTKVMEALYGETLATEVRKSVVAEVMKAVESNFSKSDWQIFQWARQLYRVYVEVPRATPHTHVHTPSKSPLNQTDQQNSPPISNSPSITTPLPSSAAVKPATTANMHQFGAEHTISAKMQNHREVASSVSVHFHCPGSSSTLSPKPAPRERMPNCASTPANSQLPHSFTFQSVAANRNEKKNTAAADNTLFINRVTMLVNRLKQDSLLSHRQDNIGNTNAFNDSQQMLALLKMRMNELQLLKLTFTASYPGQFPQHLKDIDGMLEECKQLVQKTYAAENESATASINY